MQAYDLFKKVYKKDDEEFVSLTCLFVRSALKGHSDLRNYIDDSDILSISTNVIIELMVKSVDESHFSEAVQVNSYLTKVVRHATSRYLSDVIAPMKIVNPKGGASKKEGPLLTQAVAARRASAEIDSDDYDPDYEIGLSMEAEQEEDDPRDFSHESESAHLSPFVKQVMEECKSHQIDDLISQSVDKSSSESSSLKNKKLSEFFVNFLEKNLAPSIIENSILINNIIPNINNKSKEEGQLCLF